MEGKTDPRDENNLEFHNWPIAPIINNEQFMSNVTAVSMATNITIQNGLSGTTSQPQVTTNQVLHQIYEQNKIFGNAFNNMFVLLMSEQKILQQNKNDIIDNRKEIGATKAKVLALETTVAKIQKLFDSRSSGSSGNWEEELEQKNSLPLQITDASSSTLSPTVLLEAFWHRQERLRLLLLMFYQGALFCSNVHGSPSYIIKDEKSPSGYGVLFVFSLVEKWFVFLKKKHCHFASIAETKSNLWIRLFREIPRPFQIEMTKEKLNAWRGCTPIYLTQRQTCGILTGTAVEALLPLVKRDHDKLMRYFNVMDWNKEMANWYQEFLVNLTRQQEPIYTKFKGKNSWRTVSFGSEPPIVPGSTLSLNSMVSLSQPHSLFAGLPLMLSSRTFCHLIHNKLKKDQPIAMGWSNVSLGGKFEFLSWQSLLALQLKVSEQTIREYEHKLVKNPQVQYAIVTGNKTFNDLIDDEDDSEKEPARKKRRVKRR